MSQKSSCNLAECLWLRVPHKADQSDSPLKAGLGEAPSCGSGPCWELAGAVSPLSWCPSLEQATMCQPASLGELKGESEMEAALLL